MLRARVVPSLFFTTLSLAAPGCTPSDDTGALPDGPLVVPLWWIPGEDGLAWDEARAGLWWALSNLGAAPPAEEPGLEVQDEGPDGVTFLLDLGAVGLPERSLPAMEAALAPVRAAAADGPVDLGRFLMATLYDPGRYYAITGACPTLADWRAARQAPDPGLYAVSRSLLVPGDRLVALNPVPDVAPALTDLGWLAAEGEGSLADGTFVPQELETVEVMANGQQRFAVYDAVGDLRAAGATSPAGQPGKCMWCHELHVQRGSAENPQTEGYLDYAAFIAEVEEAEAVLAAARTEATAIDWRIGTHEWAEQLTVALLEPSPARVAREWGVSVAEVEAEGLPTHTSGEYPAWGLLYARAEVDAARARREPGWVPLPTPPSDRELDADWPLVGIEGLACAPADADTGGRSAR